MILAVCAGKSAALTSLAHKVSQQAGGPGAALPGVPGGGGGGGPLPGGGAGTPEAQLAGQLAVALRHVYGGVGAEVGDAVLTLARPGQAPGASGEGIG